MHQKCDLILTVSLHTVISGASSGIGEGTAVHFAKLGSQLSLAGRSAENLKRVAGLCQEQGVSEQDVSDLDYHSSESKSCINFASA